MKAVHFGAGNIGRGFVGLLLHEAGCEVVFSDVAEALVQQLREADSYTVTTVGQHPTTTVVDGRSEEHTSELQSRFDLVCRLLLPQHPFSPLFSYTTLFRSR